MKETGTEYWNSPNTGADNETSSGFNARGGGLRYAANGTYNLKKITHGFGQAPPLVAMLTIVVYSTTALPLMNILPVRITASVFVVWRINPIIIPGLL